MRLSEYPYVIVRVACTNCPRKGRYRLARLAERYGAEMPLPWLMSNLAASCPKRDAIANTYDLCGAYFMDLQSPRPPDVPPTVVKLRVVK